MDFLHTPNLPPQKVSLAVMSGEYKNLVSELKYLNINVVETKACSNLPEPTAFHADMQLCYLGEGRGVVEKSCTDLIKNLSDLGMSIEPSAQFTSKKYPKDAALDCLIFGKICLAKSDALDMNVAKYIENKKIEPADTKQGYAKCSVCVISENAAVTADRGIFTVLTQKGADVLLIEPGGILLPGYDTGFIGGACGLIDKDTIAFTGSFSHYPHSAKLLAFLDKHKIRPIELSDGPFIDIGGIIPLACG